MNEQLASTIADTLGLDREQITPELAMETTPQWDSVAHLNLCLSIEAEFGVSFSPDEMLAMTSLRAIEAALRRHGKL